MADTVANLAVSFTANTRRFNKALRRVERRLRTVRSVAMKVGAIGGLVAGGGFAALTAQSFKLVGAQAKVSDKLGASMEDLLAWQFAAGQAGVETRTFNMAAQRFTRRLSEAAAGGGEAKDALKELGLEAKTLNDQTLSQKLLAAAGALSKVKNQGDAVRLAFKLFDSEGVVMLNLLRQNEDQLRATLQEAADLGLEMSRFDAAKIEVANDSFDKMRQSIIAVFNHLAVALAPAVFNLTQQFVQFMKASGGAGAIAAKGLQFAVNIAERAIDVYMTMKGAVLGIASAWGQVFAKILRFVKFASSGGPLGALVGSIFDIDFDPVKSLTGLDLGVLADSFENVSDNVATQAGAMFNRIGEGSTKKMIDDMIKSFGSNLSTQAGLKLPTTGPGGIAGQKTQREKVGEFRQINRSRTAFGVPGSDSRPAAVMDPQLETTNALLRQLNRGVGGGGGAAVFS